MLIKYFYLLVVVKISFQSKSQSIDKNITDTIDAKIENFSQIFNSNITEKLNKLSKGYTDQINQHENASKTRESQLKTSISEMNKTFGSIIQKKIEEIAENQNNVLKYNTDNINQTLNERITEKLNNLLNSNKENEKKLFSIINDTLDQHEINLLKSAIKQAINASVYEINKVVPEFFEKKINESLDNFSNDNIKNIEKINSKVEKVKKDARNVLLYNIQNVSNQKKMNESILKFENQILEKFEKFSENQNNVLKSSIKECHETFNRNVNESLMDLNEKFVTKQISVNYIKQQLNRKIDEHINQQISNLSQFYLSNFTSTFAFSLQNFKTRIDKEYFKFKDNVNRLINTEFNNIGNNQTTYYYDLSYNCETQCLKKTIFSFSNNTLLNTDLLTNPTRLLKKMKKKWSQEIAFITESNFEKVEINFINDTWCVFTFSFMKTNCSVIKFAKQKCQFENVSITPFQSSQIWNTLTKITAILIPFVTFCVLIIFIGFIIVKYRKSTRQKCNQKFRIIK